MKLPEGYSIKHTTNTSADGTGGGHPLLVLMRADGSVVAKFVFSAFGPDPARIRQLALEDLDDSSDLKASGNEMRRVRVLPDDH